MAFAEFFCFELFVSVLPIDDFFNLFCGMMEDYEESFFFTWLFDCYSGGF